MKTVKSYTLSPEVQTYVRESAQKKGVSQSSTLEMMLRELIELKGQTLKPVEKVS